ncbi:MAG TPA: PhoU domain-containing protein [Acidimicrobiales bacterium]|nr:PhoU domain-containing protein [Acidimicrobiales bacterium]
MGVEGKPGSLDREVAHLFRLVTHGLARATDALLTADPAQAAKVVEADGSVDELTAQLNQKIWESFERLMPVSDEMRRMVGLLSILSELERSADLAEHIAQRALAELGPKMSPVTRGIIQRMSDVGLEMWRDAADSYLHRRPVALRMDEADEELDILLDRLTTEVAASAMPLSVAAQVTLLGRFYERLGDHAVNLAKRIEMLPADTPESSAHPSGTERPAV